MRRLASRLNVAFGSASTANWQWCLVAPEAQKLVLFIRDAAKGSDVDTRLRTALSCCLAFRDDVGLTLVGLDAGVDIRATIARTR
jgi:hypothetical protein